MPEPDLNKTNAVLALLVRLETWIGWFLTSAVGVFARGLGGRASVLTRLRDSVASLPARIKRAAIIAVAAIAALSGLYALRDGPINWYEATFDKRPLQRAKSWHYHLDRIDPEAMRLVTADLIVMDHAKDGGRKPLTKAEVERIKIRPDGTKRLVIAYVSVGEAEEYRTYWNPAWTTEKDPAKMPVWHVARNCAWPDNHAVKFWHPEWKKLMYGGRDSYLGRIAAAGFDGIYLDRLDIYERFTKERPNGVADMITFVQELAAATRAINPNFLIIGQNAEDLLLHKRYRRVIDGLGKEDLLHGHDGTGVPNQKKDIDWSYQRIQRLLADYKPVFAVEYLVTREAIAEAKLELHRRGLVGTNAHRNLDGSDPTMPRFEKSAAMGTPEFTKANCDKSNSW